MQSDPNPVSHPDKVNIPAALHMASLADAYRSHSRCPPSPESLPVSHGPSLQHCPGHVSTQLRLQQTICLQDAQTLSALLVALPAGRPCCSFRHVSEWPSPRTHLGWPARPSDSPALATPHTDSTCPWCHSAVTRPKVPSSARDLPWLQIIHRLLLCPACGCRTGTPSSLPILF
jgi:hypothetical protein